MYKISIDNSIRYVVLASLSHDQIDNLRRCETLAYESDVFEQAGKDKQSEMTRREKLDAHMHHLKKLLSHVKITCEAWTDNV